MSIAISKSIFTKSLKISSIIIAIPDIPPAPRSGLALKHDLMLTNSPGTIDAGYRGEVGVIMYNGGKTPYKIERGDRIAQMVICKLPEIKLIPTDALSDSDRGKGGFGSSGKK